MNRIENKEMITDAEQKIARPRQVFLGKRKLDYAAIDQRS